MLTPDSGTIQGELARCIGRNLPSCEAGGEMAVRRVL